MRPKQRRSKLDSNPTIVQEVFAAALDWIDAIEKLDEKNIELDEKTKSLIDDKFFKGKENAEV
jgi:hypothetical protein